MTMRRKISIRLKSILGLIACAEEYGFNDEMPMAEIAKWLDYGISDDEIHRYIISHKDEDGYDDESRDGIFNAIMEFKKRYCDTIQPQTSEDNVVYPHLPSPHWQRIGNAPQDGRPIWLSNEKYMTIGYWDANQPEHWRAWTHKFKRPNTDHIQYVRFNPELWRPLDQQLN